MVSTKQQVVEILRDRQAELQRYGVRRCGLFGSFVHEGQSAGSDVDILVDFDPQQKTFDNFMQVASLLEHWLGRPVDLVTRESLSPHLGQYILQEVEYVSAGP